MSKNKFQKFIDKPLIRPEQLVYKPILISTSKGNYLKNHVDLARSYNLEIDFHCKPGGRFNDFYIWLNRELPTKLHTHKKVVLYIWLGTCDLSYKSGRFVYLRHVTDNAAVSYLIEQIDKFRKLLLRFGPSVKPVFLEIPPYSIQNWNLVKGHPDPGVFKADDVALGHRIALVNEYISCVNEKHNVLSIKFKLDLLKVRKGKHSKRISVHFADLKDGIHPTPLLARYWMKRLITRIFIDCC